MIEDLWLYRWLAIGVLTVNQYSPHQLIVPSNFVRILVLNWALTSLSLELTFFLKWLGDAQTQKAVTTWTVGSGVNHQQIGNTWSGQNDLVSLSMSGALNIFDPRTSDKPVRVFNVRPPLLSSSARLLNVTVLHRLLRNQ